MVIFDISGGLSKTVRGHRPFKGSWGRSLGPLDIYFLGFPSLLSYAKQMSYSFVPELAIASVRLSMMLSHFSLGCLKCLIATHRGWCFRKAFIRPYKALHFISTTQVGGISFSCVALIPVYMILSTFHLALSVSAGVAQAMTWHSSVLCWMAG